MSNLSSGQTEPKWQMSSFQNLTTIGRGRFGVVYKGVDPYSKITVALKLIPKKSLDSQNLQTQVQRQIEIHSKLKHRYIIQMYGWFQDQHNIYIVLEFCNGVSLFHQLRINKRVLKEQEIKSIMKQLTLAVAYIHQRNVMHRDIKLQNVMIVGQLVKLIDFGWCVHSIAQERKTFCGTIDYLAPELVKKKRYDFGVDVYSLGVLFYELFYGKAPYFHEDETKISENILKAELKLDEKEIDNGAKDLIKKMMNPVTKERVGIKDVLSHPYLSGVELEQYI